MDLRDESDVEGGVVREPDSDTFSDLDMSTEEHADNGTDSDISSDTDRDADSDFDCQVDDSSITDDEYDAGSEETRAIALGHVAIHAAHSPVHGWPKLDNSQYTINAIEGFPATRIAGLQRARFTIPFPASSLSSLANFYISQASAGLL
jgi:hypothetical protein